MTAIQAYERELSRALIEAIASIPGTQIHGVTDLDRLGLLEAGGMIRVGPVHYNTVDEIHRFGEVLQQVAAN